jgi:hypothetical protein
MTDLRESLSAKVTALFTDAMRADPQEIAVRLEGFPTPTAAFLRRSRTTALAGAAALSGVLESHRLTVGDTCLSCGTTDTCRTLREISLVFGAYLGDRPTCVDRAEAWRRADAWLHQNGYDRHTLRVEEFPQGYLAQPVPPTGFVLAIEGGSGRVARRATS